MIINKKNIKALYDFLILHKEKFIDFHKSSSEIIAFLYKSFLEKKTIILENEIENIISDFFVEYNFVFDEDTPVFFTLNRACIINSIRNDVLTFRYTNKLIEKELCEIITEEAIKQQYILKEESPTFLKSNYDVILGSVALQPDSINFSEKTDFLSKQEQKAIIDLIVNTDYVISDKTPVFLKENLQILLSSMKKDIEVFKYSTLSSHPKVIKALVDANYNFTTSLLNDAKMGSLLEDNVMNTYFNYFGMFSTLSTEAKEKNIEFIKKILSTNTLNIKSINEMLNVIIEKAWNDYKKDNSFLFVNVLGKILANLRKKEKDVSAIEQLLQNMENVLGDKFDDFNRVSVEYHKIYNSETEKKM